MKPHFSIKPEHSASADIKIHEPDVESVMREAAFVSSEGKVYRLFPENDNSNFGSPFILPESPFIEKTSDGCDEFDRTCSSAREELSRTAAVISLVQNTKEQLPLEKTFKKMRGVEGVFGRKQKPVSSSLILAPQERNTSISAKKELLLDKRPAAIPLNSICSSEPLAVLDTFAEATGNECLRKQTAVNNINLTVVKLPETLRKRSFGVLFRKKKRQTADGRQQKAIGNETLAVFDLPKERNTVEIHHYPAETENQMTAAFLAAGEEFRTKAAAVWSARVDSLQKAAYEQIKKISVRLTELHKQGKQIISFNGFFSGEGCTTVASCAARELAGQGYYVLLADTNSHHTELTSQFSTLTDSDVYGIIPIEERLHFLPFCDALIESELNGKSVTQRFTQLIAAMKKDYDFILLDNGGLSECPLEERVKHWEEMSSDAVLMVLKQQNIQRININAVVERLKKYHIEVAGITENNVPAA